MRPGNDPNRFAQDLFDGLPDRYDLLVEVLSLGQNRRWRREMLEHVGPVGPHRVLDVATGTAGVALDLARRPGALVTGVDLTSGMLVRGARNVAANGAADVVHLVSARAEELPFDDATFDGLTFTYLLRYVADPAATVRELARVVKPGAPVASLDFHLPSNPVARGLWWLYTRIALPVAGLVSGGRAWGRVGRFLGPNIAEHYRRYPIARLVDAWERAGFTAVGAKTMSLGGGLVMWGTKTDGRA